MAHPPDVIHVGPHPYRVVCEQGAMAKARVEANDVSLIGCHDGGAITITVDPDLPPSQLADTLLHEVLHAVLAHTAADSTLTSHSEGLDEYIVRAVTPLLLDVLQRNPGLVEFLTKPSDESTGGRRTKKVPGL